MGELKKKYSDKLATIKELFPDWTDEDVVYALQETDGDLEGTIERITEGKKIMSLPPCPATDHLYQQAASRNGAKSRRKQKIVLVQR